MDDTDLARYLFEAGTVLFIVLGGAHALVALVDVVRPRFFTPVDDSVRHGMTATSLRLHRNAVMWPAWLGFNISHGLGVFFFGLVLLLIAIDDFRIVTSLGFLMPLALAVSVTYLFLAIRFWFYLPAIGIGLGAACFLASYVVL